MTSNDDSRRKIVDLELLHTKLEPQLRDIYVEGRSDGHLFRWFFHEAGIPVSGVYAVDDRATVSADLVLATGSEVGPRGRVVALAHAANDWGMSHAGITCIIDADRSILVPEPPIPGLLRTDFPSVEGYLFQPNPLDRFLRLVLGSDADAARIIEAITPALNDLFVVRAVLHVEGPNVTVVEKFQKCCKFQHGVWRIDAHDLISRSLAAAGESQSRERLVSQFEMYKDKLPADLSLAVRGHDIAPMLIHVLGLKNDLAKPEVLERAWRGCLRLDDVVDQPLFRALLARLT